MRVLSVASEIYPLIKTGGLADVAGALPPALAGHGVEVRSLLPGYPGVMEQIVDGETVTEHAGLRGVPFRLVAARAAGLDLIVLDAPALFDRAGGPYTDAGGTDYGDNWSSPSSPG
jgi:starch synthase